jgi:2-amino-4-hydroxy-6-hydroxymethyldihydropteridine diphosphokinase
VPAKLGYLGLGSNVGDRRRALQAAVDELARADIAVLACSSLYDTDPVGEVPDQDIFLNACLRIATELEPLDLLDAVKAIERRVGRAPVGVRHGPRVIDIDVLMLGEQRLSHPRMQLPHAQLLSRRFVLVPALELDAELALPDGRRLADALAAAAPSEGVRWAGAPLSLP